MSGRSDPGTGRRPWLVWGAALVAYVAAVTHRSSFGVAGLLASHRFGTDATQLSMFAVVQVITYAALQLPVGLALDRFGSRRMLTLGAVAMAVGQLGMAWSTTVPTALAARVLIGAGDAATFVSAVRLVPSWFPVRQVALVSQLTAIVGQLGQVVAALPFAFLLHHAGWSTAFGSLAGLGLVAATTAGVLVRDRPPHAPARVGSRGHPLAGLGDTLHRPATWLGFWSHMVGGFSGQVFALMWGVPFLVQGQGRTTAQASALLTVNVAVAIVAGPVIGVLTGRHPLRRSWLVLGAAAGTLVGWLLVLVPATPRPMWQLVLWVALISVGGPASMVGLDYASTASPPERMGSATGIANMGGFLGAVVVMLGVGLVLDHRAPSGTFDLADYRVALSLALVVWAVAVVGVLVTRVAARRALATPVPPLADAWARYRDERRSRRP